MDTIQEPPSTPDPVVGTRTGALRASDADREATVAALYRALGEGRLDLDETDQRVAAAYAARHCDQLPPLLAHGVPSIVEVPLDLVVGVAAWGVVGAAVRNAANTLRRVAPPSADRASDSPSDHGHQVTSRVAA